MVETSISEASCAQYEWKVSINAPIHRVWDAILQDTNRWWPPDFHMVDPESVVEFDVSPGGKGLMERHRNGRFLQWYAVQCFMPEQFKIYLVGNIAPDWGGPSTSNLCLNLTEEKGACILSIVDALHGRVSPQSIESLKAGWQQLLGEGLRTFVERAAE